MQVLAERADRLKRDDAPCVADAMCHAQRVPTDVRADVEHGHARLDRSLQQARRVRFERAVLDQRSAQPGVGSKGPLKAGALDVAAGGGKDGLYVRGRCHSLGAIGRISPWA